MTISSAGNLLVSTSSDFASGTVDGVIAQGTNKPAAAFSNTADGQIVKFYQGGNLVGAIDSYSDTIQFGQGNVNLKFSNADDAITPANDSGTVNSGDLSLGASNAKFKDLYLSGGVRGTSNLDITVPETAGAAIHLEFGNNTNTTRRTVRAYKDNFEPNTADTGVISLGQAANKWKDLYLSGIAYANYVGSSGDTDTTIAFDTANTVRVVTGGDEAFRITGAQDMYFGSSSGDAADVGHIMQANGALYNTRDGGTVQYLRRLNSDGDILQFNKDGTAVGSIGTASSRVYIGTGDTGLRFTDDEITPFNPSVSADRDGTVDLGGSSTRFKDLYLSGGIRLSGSDMLNYYEKGSWTPKIAHNDGTGEISLTVTAATYVRIGSLCYVQGYLRAINPNGNQGTSSPYYGIRNFPFTPQNYGVWNLAYASSNITSYGGYSSSANFYFLLPTGSAPVGQGHVSGTTFNGYGSGLTLMFNATYYVYGT